MAATSPRTIEATEKPHESVRDGVNGKKKSGAECAESLRDEEIDACSIGMAYRHSPAW